MTTKQLDRSSLSKEHVEMFNALASFFVHPFSPAEGYCRLARMAQEGKQKNPRQRKVFERIVRECVKRIEALHDLQTD